MPQRYFIHTLLNLLQRTQAAIARWIKPGMEAGTTPALDPTVTVSILPAALTARPAAPGRPRPGPGSGAQPTGRSRGVPLPPAPHPRPGRAATGKLRLGEARAEGSCWLGSASPGGPPVSLPPPCESCMTGFLGQVTSEGGASRNTRLYGFPSREARKRSEAFPKRSIS